MNKGETAKILALLKELYPNGKEATKNTVNAWHEVLKEYEFSEMWIIANRVAREYEGYTVPPPAVLINKYKALTEDTPIELWNIAEKAIKKGSSFTRQDFEKLPVSLKQYFGSVSTIHELGRMEISNLQFEKNRFIKQIKVIEERYKQPIQIGEIAKIGTTRNERDNKST